jgi:hypothetical protein
MKTQYLVKRGYWPALFGSIVFGFCVCSLAYYASYFVKVVDVSSSFRLKIATPCIVEGTT